VTRWWNTTLRLLLDLRIQENAQRVQMTVSRDTIGQDAKTFRVAFAHSVFTVGVSQECIFHNVRTQMKECVCHAERQIQVNSGYQMAVRCVCVFVVSYYLVLLRFITFLLHRS